MNESKVYSLFSKFYVLMWPETTFIIKVIDKIKRLGQSIEAIHHIPPIQSKS